MYSALVGAISGGISGAIVSFVVGLGASMFLSKRPQRPQEPDKEGALGKLKKSCLPLLSRKLPFQCQTYQVSFNMLTNKAINFNLIIFYILIANYPT